MLRIFIGIALQNQIKDALFALSSDLMGEIKGARWVSRDNIHLTLKFLGSVAEERIDELAGALSESITEFRRFSCSLGPVGAFPSLNRARVLWVGIDYGAADLIQLSERVEAALEPFGFESERRPFTPHITLARLNPPKPVRGAVERLSEASFKGRTVNIDGLTIFRSHLKPTGAEYSSLRFIPFKA